MQTIQGAVPEASEATNLRYGAHLVHILCKSTSHVLVAKVTISNAYSVYIHLLASRGMSSQRNV